MGLLRNPVLAEGLSAVTISSHPPSDTVFTAVQLPVRDILSGILVASVPELRSAQVHRRHLDLNG